MFTRESKVVDAFYDKENERESHLLVLFGSIQNIEAIFINTGVLLENYMV